VKDGVGSIDGIKPFDASMLEAAFDRFAQPI